MNRGRLLLFFGILAASVVAVGTLGDHEKAMPNAGQRPPKRVGMVIGIKPNYIEPYKRLHAKRIPGVRDLLRKYHMHNFSIFIHKMPDGNWYEFGYYEYTGQDFGRDMAQLAGEPRNIEWLKICNPMQIPLPGAKGWTEMQPLYFNE